MQERISPVSPVMHYSAVWLGYCTVSISFRCAHWVVMMLLSLSAKISAGLWCSFRWMHLNHSAHSAKLCHIPAMHFLMIFPILLFIFQKKLLLRDINKLWAYFQSVRASGLIHILDWSYREQTSLVFIT